jgi:putative GTP pyrophosphokinase
VASEISKTQIDRLGNRLRKGDITDADLRLLDEYRRSFSDAYEFVVGAIRNELRLEPTGRPAKSTTSIAEKLLRESIRLTQIQDIAGCRIVVPEITDQNRVVESLTKLFNNASIMDRRKQPSHGYRAVHVVADCGDKLVEIQVRTQLQHLWAEQSEKLSDVVDRTIKYGGGDERTQELLRVSSDVIAGVESLELELADDQGRLSLLLTSDDLTEEKRERELR